MFSIFKRNNEQTSARQLKRYYKIVEQINNLEEKYVNKSDAELREMTFIFKDRLRSEENQLHPSFLTHLQLYAKPQNVY
ncbi:hypothetical protein LSPH24S_05722 [Lysinibacillus sphaericus]